MSEGQNFPINCKNTCQNVKYSHFFIYFISTYSSDNILTIQVGFLGPTNVRNDVLQMFLSLIRRKIQRFTRL